MGMWGMRIWEMRLESELRQVFLEAHALIWEKYRILVKAQALVSHKT